ncbi:hypothetical protein B0T25DRAFT_110468 [Lasiosphaeria hispida]|uniref:Uncharacterized protein n=1 Tax=Lasiosphaeria hispida TaxID=260671 RepID=A0AAJ0MI99_9PEZI|nr:hypothetical protein B0T25DRAFT_110468 [Lasiosphaeria hispida]
MIGLQPAARGRAHTFISALQRHPTSHRAAASVRQTSGDGTWPTICLCPHVLSARLLAPAGPQRAAHRPASAQNRTARLKSARERGQNGQRRRHPSIQRLDIFERMPSSNRLWHCACFLLVYLAAILLILLFPFCLVLFLYGSLEDRRHTLGPDIVCSAYTFVFPLYRCNTRM